jgi:hypothetical protein
MVKVMILKNISVRRDEDEISLLSELARMSHLLEVDRLGDNVRTV